MTDSILICLEKLGIGGVETAVLSQTKAFLKKGFKVVVLAQDGIYKKKLEEIGAKHISFEFPLENNYNIEKAKQIAEIIKKEQITQVHIEQYPCILSALPACQITGTPYVAYLHMAPRVQEEIINWFLNQFDIYQTAFPTFFNNAYKIVAITKSNVNYHKKLFNIPEEKYVVCFNSIDFEQYQCEEKENTKTKFLLPTRFTTEKINSIKNGIDIFSSYLKNKNNALLKIAGDGICKKEIEEYIISKHIPAEQIEFIGNRNDIPNCIEQCDIVLGVDRVILEGITCKKITIITGYDNCKGIVIPEKIYEIMQENFSGMNMESTTPEEIARTLNLIDLEDIRRITDENYKFVKENLAIEDNVYFISEIKNLKYEECLLQDIIKLEEIRQEAKNKEKQLKEQINQTEKEKKETIVRLEQELQKIYNSRRWKYSTKIIEMFKK